MRPRFDVFSDTGLDDPYPLYRRLRDASAIWRGGPGQWVLTRYADVAAGLRDQRLAQFHFAAAYRMFPEANLTGSLGEGPASQFIQHSLVTRNRPEHTRVRRLMNQAVTPQVLAELRESVHGWVDDLLASCVARGFIDAVPDLAFPLPLKVLGKLAGITEPEQVGRRLLKLTKIFAPVVPDADRIAADDAVRWLRGYVAALDRTPTLAALHAAEDAGGLTRDEVIDNVIFLLFAGFETSLNLISTGCRLLAAHQHEQARLRAEPSLIPTAVEEFLRFDTPTQVTARIVMEPVTIAGQTIRPGRILLLLLGSANRDERRFPDPDRFDVGRDPNPHVSFGGGVHYCLGAALARVEAAILFERLLDRFGILLPAGEVVRQPGATLRGYTSVPLKVAA